MKLNDKLPKEANKYRFKGVVYRGRSKKEDVQLTTRYECKEITPLIVTMNNTINELDNMCFNLCNMFGGEIINELNTTCK